MPPSSGNDPPHHHTPLFLSLSLCHPRLSALGSLLFFSLFRPVTLRSRLPSLGSLLFSSLFRSVTLRSPLPAPRSRLPAPPGPLLIGADTGVGPRKNTVPANMSSDTYIAAHLEWIELLTETCGGLLDAVSCTRASPSCFLGDHISRAFSAPLHRPPTPGVRWIMHGPVSRRKSSFFSLFLMKLYRALRG